jgi:uncharacterized membrane protein YgcG
MFRCIYNFTAQLTGKSYFKGERIGNSEYATLRMPEKTFFVDEEREDKEETRNHEKGIDILSDIATSIASSLIDSSNDSSSFDSSSDSNDFGGFGGGDFCGGGAGGDF